MKPERQLVRRKRVHLMNRVRGLDCMLEDIEMEIQRLRDEWTHLCQVREALTDRLSAGLSLNCFRKLGHIERGDCGLRLSEKNRRANAPIGIVMESIGLL